MILLVTQPADMASVKKYGATWRYTQELEPGPDGKRRQVQRAGRHRRNFSQRSFIGATLRGGVIGGLMPYGLATGGRATGWGQIGKRIFDFTFRGHKTWGGGR
ncbi:MAG: hypothetical protein JWN55_68 [Frankiales bacterium]|nr:hypothetical protein [Frankiales bacterium]